MKKQLAVGTFLIGSIMLLGAGCTPETLENKTDEQPITTTEPVAEQITTTAVAFTLQVAPQGNGTVKLNWTAPADLAKNSKIRIINARTENQDVGTGAYWRDLNTSNTDFTWEESPVGSRLFKICELADGQCQRTSAVVSADVK